MRKYPETPKLSDGTKIKSYFFAFIQKIFGIIFQSFREDIKGSSWFYHRKSQIRQCMIEKIPIRLIHGQITCLINHFSDCKLYTGTWTVVTYSTAYLSTHYRKNISILASWVYSYISDTFSWKAQAFGKRITGDRIIIIF